jgi:hypothetical protein
MCDVMDHDPTSDPAGSRLSALLSSAADVAPSEPAPALMQAMAVEVRSTLQPAPQPRSRPVLAKIITAKVAALTAAVALTATGAAAATGSLPDAAQDGLSKAAERVGVNLPDSADDDAVDATTDLGPDAEEETVEETPEVEETEAGTTGAERSAHGQMVVTIAQADYASGRERGAAVSAAARGDHGPDDAPEQETADNADAAPVETPNHGAAATQDGNPAADAAPVETPADDGAPGGGAPEDPQATGDAARSNAADRAAGARAEQP